MALLVGSTTELNTMPVGATITVANRDTPDQVTVYTKNEDNRWEANDDKPTIRASAFMTAIGAGRVGVDGTHRVGDWLYNTPEDTFYKVLRVCHGKYTFAKVRGATLQGVVTDAVGVLRTEPMPRAWDVVADQAAAQAEAGVAQERLDQILASGVIPAEVEHTATVVVKGTTQVTPDRDQVRQMFGDDANITNVNAQPTTVDWEKTFEVTKNSRWDCVCSEVTQEDVNALTVPGPITSWQVIGCE